MNRRELLQNAVNNCMRELYSYVYPKVSWKSFKLQCKKYNKKYKEWEKLDKETKPSAEDYCGPKPYEFYFLPKEVMRDICDSYIYTYRIDQKEDFESDVKIFLNYCMNPIRDKYIEEIVDEHGNRHPGYRGYEYFTPITEILNEIITNCRGVDSKEIADEVWYKVLEYYEEAKNFYNWTSELNSFNTSVYLGASPCSNKETVIENWKKYRNVDIEIDENEIKREYYGDDEDYSE